MIIIKRSIRVRLKLLLIFCLLKHLASLNYFVSLLEERMALLLEAESDALLDFKGLAELSLLDDRSDLLADLFPRSSASAILATSLVLVKIGCLSLGVESRLIKLRPGQHRRVRRPSLRIPDRLSVVQLLLKLGSRRRKSWSRLIFFEISD
jgi:hypothetical protein